MICPNLIHYAFHIKIYLWHVSIRQIPLFCEKSSYKAIKMRCPHFKTNNCNHNLNICRVNIFHTSLKMATGCSFRLLKIFSIRTQSVVCFVVEIFFTGRPSNPGRIQNFEGRSKSFELGFDHFYNDFELLYLNYRLYTTAFSEGWLKWLRASEAWRSKQGLYPSSNFVDWRQSQRPMPGNRTHISLVWFVVWVV